jgi:hypothetical protein
MAWSRTADLECRLRRSTRLRLLRNDSPPRAIRLHLQRLHFRHRRWRGWGLVLRMSPRWRLRCRLLRHHFHLRRHCQRRCHYCYWRRHRHQRRHFQRCCRYCHWRRQRQHRYRRQRRYHRRYYCRRNRYCYQSCRLRLSPRSPQRLRRLLPRRQRWPPLLPLRRRRRSPRRPLHPPLLPLHQRRLLRHRPLRHPHRLELAQGRSLPRKRGSGPSPFLRFDAVATSPLPAGVHRFAPSHKGRNLTSACRCSA